MHNKMTYRAYILALLAVGLAGCATSTPKLDDHFGDAVNAAKAQQTLNPDASQNTAPVVGLDGQAAGAAVDRYQKSFERPPVSSNVFNIGVGNSTGTGASSSGGAR